MKNRKIITVTLLILSVVLLTFVSCSSKTEVQGIFSNGQTEYKIITAQGASSDEEALAKELSALSGDSLKISSDTASESAYEILIGETNRGASSDIVKKLVDIYTASAFHYAVAECDGKLVILSDTEVGYIYALEYIKETYITDGVLSVPKGTCDIKEVIWDVYYASELYYNRVVAEADQNRYDNEKEQLENEMNKYEDNKNNSTVTVEQMILQYKNKIASFKTEAFGEYTSASFTSVNKYDKPTVYPEAENHPRILFTDKKSSKSGKSTLDSVRENLTADQNSAAYKTYIALSDNPWDGQFRTLTGNETYKSNYSGDKAAILEAKAFRYVMTGDKIYGYEAIYAAKNAILTIDVSHTVGDWCRTYGHLMYVVACVYDWCYDLLTEDDKAQLINGCVNLLGMHFEIVIGDGASNKAPTSQGTMYGHGAEDQILVDYLAFAIACFDEAPEIYDLVGGRVLNDFTEAQNYLSASGAHWEGSMYGSVRTVATIVSNLLINKMSNGAATPFENIEDLVTAATYYIRPDGHVWRIGDINENNTAYQFVWFANNCFYAGNLYENEYLKSFAYKYLQKFSSFSNMVAGLSAVQFLAVNNPEVSNVYEGTVPLTYTASYPNTSIFAKSANNDKTAFGVFMTMPENYVASHAHAECGSFQIYYKGALVSDSGAYDSWSGSHNFGYNMQTISSNSLLIYNPNLKDYLPRSDYKTMIYSGGQLMGDGALPETLGELLEHSSLNQCTSLGVANVEVDGVYLYSYMGGDMTNAYHQETVDEVARYMFAVATGNEDCPLVFLTFDRITSDDAAYHKSALIHVQTEPTISGDYAIVTNGEGKLVVQTVGYDTEYTVIGGEGREFWIPGVDENGNYSLEDGKNIPHRYELVDGSLAEYGWGRIEISPAEAEKTNYMLTVMYVTDAANNSYVKAEDICSDTLAGSKLFGKAVLFPKDDGLLESEASFTLTAGADCYVAGVKKGNWNVIKNGQIIETVTAAEGENLITFSVSAGGEYTISPAN
ncbi:MAG: hypothetical protein IKJ13_05730 [Clostridia bacterium]|nr:hypothetical protein [Clostridia bacterium]